MTTENNDQNKEDLSKQSDKQDTKTLQDTPKDSRIDDLIGVVSQLAESNRVIGSRLEQFEKVIEERNKPKPEITEAKTNFLQDPDKALKETKDSLTATVKEMLAETVKPLQQRFAEDDKESALEKLKDKYAKDPRFKKLFEKASEHVDMALSQIANPSDANIRGTLYGLLGAIQAGDVKGVTLEDEVDTNRNKDKDKDMLDAPSRRPSPPPRPTDDSAKDLMQRRVDALDENQRRLAKESGLKLEDYIAWLDEEAESVVKSKIGVAQKEDK